MALGWAMMLKGGEARWAKPLLLIQACQLASFALTTLRTMLGLGRIRLYLREVLVVGMAALGLHLPHASSALLLPPRHQWRPHRS